MDTRPMRFVTSLAFGTFASLAFSQTIFGNSSKAYSLMPSEAISSGVVSQILISHSGRLILFQRQKVVAVSEKQQGPKTWYVHDRVAKTTKQLDIPAAALVIPMSDDSHLVFGGPSSLEKSGILNLKTGKIVSFNLQSGRIIYGGDQPFAPFVMFGNRTGDVTLMAADGKSKIVNFGENIAVSFPVEGDDQNIVFHSMVINSKPRAAMRLTLNMATGKVTQKPYSREQEILDFRAGERTPIFHISDSGELSSIAILSNPSDAKSPLPSFARIGPGSGKVQLSPRNDYVVYLDAGSLLLREIHPTDLALAKKLTDEEALKSLISRAKQIGTALGIYASDYDDSLPGQEGWETKLMPYTKNRDVLRDFNYTFRGGEMGSIQDVTTTELGFFVTNGGRVVVYADTTVKFIPDP